MLTALRLSSSELDIDGVLNYTQWYVSDRNPGNLNGQEGDIDPLCVERVLRIVEKTGAKVVISSDWRISWEGTLMRLERMGLPRDVVIDKTPELIWTKIGRHNYMVMDDSDEYEYSRGREVDMWLEEHPECTNFVILDDRMDFTEDQQPHLVHVNSMHGLSDDDVNIAIMTLNHH